MALARHSISHRIHILNIIVRGYRSLLLHTLTPAKVVLLRGRVVHIITSGTTCVVQVGRAIKDAILAWGLALCVAASTWLPILLIQVP